MTERRGFTRRMPRIGAGGVVMLSSLIFLVAMVALIAGSLAVRQLTGAAAESKRLFGVQERADMLLRLQLNEQTSLRGYLISRNSAFLEPYLSEADPFEEQARTLRGDLSASDLVAARQHLDEMLALHRRWRGDYADPLIVNSSPHQIASLEAYGKLLDDGIRMQAAALRSEIDAKNRRVEASLEANIDSTVLYSVGFVSIVALVVLYLVLVQRSTYVAFMRERSIAESLQAVLGMGWQAIPGCSVGSSYVSATTGADVGGDLFDAWRLDDRLGVVMIADMSGKGIEAVVNTAFCKYSIRALLAAERDPA
ncbi:MAG: CHASE3 domain-containing protein, partial [Vulcanimicrobiaceae bacterium]